jgi:hypothetical protein
MKRSAIPLFKLSNYFPRGSVQPTGESLMGSGPLLSLPLRYAKFVRSSFIEHQARLDQIIGRECAEMLGAAALTIRERIASGQEKQVSGAVPNVRRFIGKTALAVVAGGMERAALAYGWAAGSRGNVADDHAHRIGIDRAPGVPIIPSQRQPLEPPALLGPTEVMSASAK